MRYRTIKTDTLVWPYDLDRHTASPTSGPYNPAKCWGRTRLPRHPFDSCFVDEASPTLRIREVHLSRLTTFLWCCGHLVPPTRHNGLAVHCPVYGFTRFNVLLRPRHSDDFINLARQRSCF